MLNPLLDEFCSVQGDRLYHRFHARDELVRKYAWAIPSAAAIETLVKYSPLVEIGAGTGYWGSLVKQASGDIICYDINVTPVAHYPINFGSIQSIESHPERTLFLCWPPYDEPMAADCLTVYSGKYFIYVGEGHGGCTGDEEFHLYLKEAWEVEERVELPQWGGIHDEMVVYKRK